MTTYKRRNINKEPKLNSFDEVFGYSYNSFLKKPRYKKNRKAQSLSYKKIRYKKKYQIGEEDAYWYDDNF